MSVAIEQGSRAAGVLLHPTSLPSGKLDAGAYRWLDWLAESGFSVWQVLPLTIPLTGLSPYQCASAFALNPALFDLASESSLASGKASVQDFEQWYEVSRDWVDDFALFMVLKQKFAGRSWLDWPDAYRQRDSLALQAFREQHIAELDHHLRQQFECWLQWKKLRQYASRLDIRLFGDIPIFVDMDSADVWAHPELFLLDENRRPQAVTGVPPDYFSATGQRWGNPHYDWNRMREDGFAWWRRRLTYNLEFFDLVRIDHFRGLEAVWKIPVECETAIEGVWEQVPGDEFLQTIQDALGSLPLVAEDLGIITPEVTALRDKFGLPGMSVLQFAFDHFDDNPHKAHNVTENRVYYSGTHDNDTSLGWFNALNEGEQQHVRHVLGCGDECDIADALLKTVLYSRAGLAMFPLQDLLRLGSEARMNTPGTVTGNWGWRYDRGMLPDDLSERMRELIQQAGRLQ
ncbi:MAG: 4-alpha-glucanotransferase [Thiolinea sp.]